MTIGEQRDPGTLLDRPLGPVAEPAPVFEEPIDGSDGSDPFHPEEEHRRSRDRHRGPLIALVVAGALALGLLAGYLWPRPGPARLEPGSDLVDFGSRVAGSVSEPYPLTLVSRGEAVLAIERLELLGDHAADFRLVEDGCTGHRVTPGDRCRLALVFAPPPVPARGPQGERHGAALRVSSNAVSGPLTVPLLGTRVSVQLEAQPGELIFETEVGRAAPPQVVVVSNRGSAPARVERVTLDGASAADFLLVADGCSGATLEPGQTCALRLGYNPREAGSAGGGLKVAVEGGAGSPPVRLTGTALGGAPRLRAEPERLAFGQLAAGGPAVRRSLALINTGPGPLTVDRVSAPEPVAVAADGCGGRSLPPGGRCSLELSFDPAREVVVGGDLVVGARGAGGSAEHRVAVTAVAIVPRLELVPQRLDWGEVPTGDAVPRSLEVENPGPVAATVGTVEVTGDHARSFAVDAGTCGGRVLQPEERCALAVTFAPGAEGPHHAALRVEPGGGTVALAGVGAMGRPVVDRDRLDFGGVRISASSTHRLTVTNRGRAPLKLGAVAIAGENAADFRVVGNGCGGALPPAAACEITVRFAPLPGTGASRGGRLLLAHGGAAAAPGVPLEVALTGTALPPPAPELAVTPPAVGFGRQRVGERSAISTVTLRNTGSARLEPLRLAIEGSDAGDFRLVPGSCDGLPFLAPGGDCTTGLRFAPTGPGPRRAWLVIHADLPGGPRRVELTGDGLAAGP
jgi:hypothetical protein